MINIRKIKILKPNSLLGKILRLPFRFIPDEAVITILKGPLRGKRWINSSHNKSIWFGVYERNQTRHFINKITLKKVFWDLGAHVGYYTLLFSTLRKDGIAYCFEPSARNVEYFKRHMALNNINNFKMFQVAVSNEEGVLKFSKGATSVAGKLLPSGDQEVNVIRLSSWYSNNMIEYPDVIKMDIEGAEIDVLMDISPLLTVKRPVIFLSTHSDRIHHECISILRGIGYSLMPLDDRRLEHAREILAEWVA